MCDSWWISLFFPLFVTPISRLWWKKSDTDQRCCPLLSIKCLFTRFVLGVFHFFRPSTRCCCYSFWSVATTKKSYPAKKQPANGLVYPRARRFRVFYLFLWLRWQHQLLRQHFVYSFYVCVWVWMDRRVTEQKWNRFIWRWLERKRACSTVISKWSDDRPMCHCRPGINDKHFGGLGRS